MDSDIEILNSFANLPIGWDYGQGGPISGIVISRAKAAYMLVNKGGTPCEIIPNSDDTIKMSFVKGEKVLDIIISESKYGVIAEHGVGESYETIADKDDLKLMDLRAAKAMYL